MYVDLEFTQGTFYDVTVRFAHKLGPYKLHLYWESDTLDKQVIPPSAFYNQLCSQFTPFVIQVVPDISNSTTTMLQDPLTSAIVDAMQTQTIVARDSYGNVQNHKLDVFLVTIVEVATGTLQTVNLWNVANGIYSFSYTLMTAGAYSVDISLQMNG